MKVNTTKQKVTASVIILAVAALIIGIGTWAAFSSTTSNTGNDFASGTVVLSDNDGGSSLFDLTDLKPGDTSSQCIKVDYTGSLPASVRLYGATSGPLAQYLDVKVTRGSISSGSFSDCANFTADATNYTGAGAGVVFSNTLNNYPANYAAGLVDPTPASPEVWSSGETHAYRIQVTQQDNNAAQGLTANASFTWEARNN